MSQPEVLMETTDTCALVDTPGGQPAMTLIGLIAVDVANALPCAMKNGLLGTNGGYASISSPFKLLSCLLLVRLIEPGGQVRPEKESRLIIAVFLMVREPSPVPALKP
jgi:hypothetical protein